MAIRVLIVDDHSVVREGLRMFLERDPELEVVGEAADGAEAVRLAQQLQPDIVLMDLLMPGMDGIAATAALRRVVPKSVVVILSISDDPQTREQAHAAGAIAFVEKHGSTDTLFAAIRQAAGQTNESSE